MKIIDDNIIFYEFENNNYSKEILSKVGFYEKSY